MSVSSTPDNISAWRFKVFLGLFFAAIIAGKFMYSYQDVLIDPDSWWHIKTGMDTLANGRLPLTDSYSHTFFGRPWIAKEWLSQVLMALAFLGGKWNGVSLLTAAAISGTGFAVYMSLAAKLRPHLALVVTMISMVPSSAVFLARPHMMVMLIVVVWTAIIFRTADELKPPRFSALILLVLWSNLHSSFTLGMVIAGFGLLHVVEQTRFSNRPLIARWAVFVLMCPLVALIHPYFYQPFVISIEMMRGNEATQFITEWQPFNAQTAMIPEGVIILYLLAFLMLRLKLSWSKALFILFSLHMMLTHFRFSYVFFMLVPISVASELALRFPGVSAETWVSQKRDAIEAFAARYFGPIVLASSVVAVVAGSIFLNLKSIQPAPEHGPVDAIAFAQTHELTGNVFNYYDFGGPLIFHGIKTFIDGRAEQIFLDGFITKVIASASPGGEQKFQELLKDYSIDWSILPPGDARIDLLDTYPDWQRAYADKYAVIHVRKDFKTLQ